MTARQERGPRGWRRAEAVGAGSPGLVVAARIGEWPRFSRAADVRRRVVEAPMAEVHARWVWTAVRGEVIRQAGAIRDAAGWDVQRIGGLTDLAFVAGLGAHLVRCGECHRAVGRERDTPIGWLTWAVRRRRNLATVFEPVLLEVTDRSARTARAARTARNGRADGPRRGRAAS